jgi:transcriptional regulator with XRE-family HTH domain
MAEIAHSIDLNLEEKLRERSYRQKFFLAESSARIAAQLITLRKLRGLSQKEVADIIGTQQPAISRAEQADYQNWSFTTLRGIADALDARIRVLIEPSEDVIKEYSRPPEDAAEQNPVGLNLAAVSVEEGLPGWLNAFGSIVASDIVQDYLASEGTIAANGATQRELMNLSVAADNMLAANSVALAGVAAERIYEDA